MTSISVKRAFCFWVAVALVGAGCDRPRVADDAGSDPSSDASVDAGVDARVAEPDASMESDAGGADGGADGGAPVCGDGVVEGDEECDEGAANSDTEPDACRTDCTAPACGDGVIDTDEGCDGTALGGRTCVDEGFASGTLQCASDCAFDTSLCEHEPGPVCGDGMREGDEICDGADVGSATCAGEGFDGGTLACTETCTLDTTACFGCGDGVLNGDEACDGADLGGATCATRPGFASGRLACDASCGFDESGCSAAATPSAAGDLVITEIMQDPAAFNDADGEWFEVHNPGAEPLNLYGCEIHGAGATESFTVDRNVVVAPGGYATFAVSTTEPGAPGFVPDYSWTGSFSLTNGSDAITIVCGSTPIDTVAWDDGATFPDPTGASMSLSPSALSATLNDAGSSWCVATSTYGEGASPDRGTPGAPNDDCPEPFTIDFCRLQPPTDLTAGVDIGTTITAYGRYHAAGVTDDPSGTTVTPPPPNLRAQVGYGPDGSDPATGGWTWLSASANTAYGPGSDAYEPDHDEYQASFPAPGPAGAYDFAFRFSGDNGASWIVCDGGEGSADGYAAADAGQLVTIAPPRAPWINELHYDNISGDVDEGVEIAGTAGTDLTSYRLIGYNGAGGAVYKTVTLSGTIPDQAGGFGTRWFDFEGLQNGNPDGIALVDPSGAVVEFLCYGGTFTAVGGPAGGTTCVDIGVSEPGATPVGQSLQRTGTGSGPADFTWTGPVPHSRGMINAGQTIE